MFAGHQSGSGLIILEKARPAPISKTNAYCIVLLLTPRVLKKNGLVIREIPAHWERLTSDGCVMCCHTYLEATEAASLCGEGIRNGSWTKIRIESWEPRKNDIPYHDWVRGMRDQALRNLGLSEHDMPEQQDASLARLSDTEWLQRGPR